MNEKPCCSLQITRAALVSQIRMEVTARQRSGMMDSPHSKSSMLTGSFLSHSIGKRGLSAVAGQARRRGLGAGGGGLRGGLCDCVDLRKNKISSKF